MKQRLLYLDNLKGFLIILVILGHCIEYGTESFDENTLFKIIYSFHMPVFIALSGCLFALKRYDLRSLVSKKFKRLLISFFVVWLAWNLPIKSFTGYYNNVSVSGMFLQMIFPSCVYLW